MKRIRTYRFWNVATRILAGIIALQSMLFVLKLWRNPVIGFLTAIAAFVAVACELFSLACPFCNRPLPGKAFKQPGKYPCAFCGKEIDIV